MKICSFLTRLPEITKEISQREVKKYKKKDSGGRRNTKILYRGGGIFFYSRLSALAKNKGSQIYRDVDRISLGIQKSVYLNYYKKIVNKLHSIYVKNV